VEQSSGLEGARHLAEKIDEEIENVEQDEAPG